MTGGKLYETNESVSDQTVLLFYYGREFKKKVSEKLIVKLNNIDEVNYLISKGIGYGYEGISHTTSKHSGITYYLAESKRNMKVLNEYRRNIIAK